MMKKEFVRDWLALALWDNLGPVGMERIRRSVPSPWRALTDNRLLDIVFSGKKHPGAVPVKHLRNHADTLMELAEKKVFDILTTLDTDYPERLANIPSPPAVLYTSGDRCLLGKPAIAVVGTRRPTQYGRDVTAFFAKTLAQHGYVIISGMAVGIDGIAHNAALDAEGYTVAVLGCGLDNPYPKTNRSIRKRVETNGCVVSEFPWGTPPNPGQFPRRNRIISGLAMGVLIVESTHKSGALITIGHAIDQNRDVFAVPGSVFAAESTGPIRVMQNGGYPVLHPDDIIAHFSGQKTIPFENTAYTSDTFDVDPELQPIWDLLDTTPVSVDDLIGALNWNPSDIQSALLHMELLGLIKQLPGQHYVRNVTPNRQKDL